MPGLSCCRSVPAWVRMLLLALCVAIGAHSAPNLDLLQAVFAQRWGSTAMPNFLAWRDLIVSGAGTSEPEQLKRANDFFNRRIVFSDDSVIWGQADYWATPLETLGRGSGDCEDFVIAKYYSLQLMGIAADKLRLIYVRARTGTVDSMSTQAHMVLAYYARPDAEPLVLDNLIGDIRLASRRPDLSPVFSFNAQGIYAGASGAVLAPAIGSGRLSRWDDLLKRTRAEGFEQKMSD